MNEQRSAPASAVVVWIVLLAVPLLLLLSLPGGSVTTGGLWMWIMFLLFVWLIVSMVAGQLTTDESATSDEAAEVGP